MRLKIRAKDSAHLSQLRQMAQKETDVFLESQDRLFLSTGELSAAAQDRMRETGARITRDRVYQMDNA